MSVQLNHTIVSCRDQQRSAAFLTGVLGLPPATRFGYFLVVEADNEAVLPGLPGGAFDLIYIDPPFNTGRRQRRAIELLHVCAHPRHERERIRGHAIGS